MSIISYCPEMGEAKPQGMDGNVSYALGWRDHYFIETPLTLSGQGVKFVEVLRSSNLTERGQYKAGWNVYSVTSRALDKLAKQHSFARESLLD